MLIGLHGSSTATIRCNFELIAKFFHHAVFTRTEEADGDESKIRLDEKLRASNRLALFINLAALHMSEFAVFADEFKRCHLKLAISTFSLTGRRTHLGCPIRPNAELVFSFRRLRTNIELRDIDRALTESCTNAVRCRITTADNDDVLATGKDWRFVPCD
ncbi:hypothetical protein D3C80_487320 [compost metagenome]